MTMKTTRSPIKECDIRGEYPSEVNEVLFDRLAQNFGRTVLTTRFSNLTPNIVLVGGDARISTPHLKEKVLSGLAAQGVQVTHLEGMVPTPMIYWAKQQMNAQGVAIITASHNQPDWNGLKVMNGNLPPSAEDIRQLADEPPCTEASAPGIIRIWKGVHNDYIEEKKRLFSSVNLSRMKIVVDPGNGCQTRVASNLLEGLHAHVIEIHEIPDGRFPHRHPDCSRKEHLTELSKRVQEENADLGIAFDGDGDRLAIIDNLGNFVTPEQVAMLFLKGSLKPTDGQSVIIDIKSTMHLDQVVRETGGRPVRCRSGHTYIKSAVIEQNAILGCEVSGHHFLGELHGLDDPLHVAVILCRDLAGGAESLSERIASLPSIHMTPDMRIEMEEEDIRQLLEECRSFTDAEIETIDGVRLCLKDGWFLVRRSVTEQAITFRQEGESTEALTRIGDLVARAFPVLAEKINSTIRS